MGEEEETTVDSNVPQMKNVIWEDRRGELQKSVADKGGD
jgi:hypothetical protein